MTSQGGEKQIQRVHFEFTEWEIKDLKALIRMGVRGRLLVEQMKKAGHVQRDARTLTRKYETETGVKVKPVVH